jgi:hypothetical protein
VVWRASSGGERNPAEAVGVEVLGRGGEERGERMSAVEMAKGVAPFYRIGEAIGQGGWPAIVGIQYQSFQRVKGGGELMGRHRLDGGNEEGGRRFSLATHARRRAADGGADWG